jgi:hypothetical protein
MVRKPFSLTVLQVSSASLCTLYNTVPEAISIHSCCAFSMSPVCAFVIPYTFFFNPKVRYGFRLNLELGPASGSGLNKFREPVRQWRQIFVGPQCRIRFMSHFWEVVRYLLYCEAPETQSTLCSFLLRYILIVSPHMFGRDSVVSVVTRLLGGLSGLPSPAGAREFSVLQNIRTGCRAHLAPS